MAPGYLGLLNLDAQPHWTIFLTDFSLPARDRRRLENAVDDERTRAVFVRVDRGLRDITQTLRSAGVKRNAYLSFHGIVSSFASLEILDELYEAFSRSDLTRLDLPFRECGAFKVRFASHLVSAVTQADYAEQDRIAERFFELLRAAVPYRVVIESMEGQRFHIEDAAAWFQLAGRLHNKETRALPGGEVAYMGDRIEGTFIVDGAILASPETPAVGADAERISRIGRQLRHHPLRLEISAGRVERICGNDKVAGEIEALFEIDGRYRLVSEVGISFNRACNRFLHSWPAASNEGRPGVHVGLGGDPDHREERRVSVPLVHVDLMAANCTVNVNGKTFLRART